ncbi:hypothetical protein BC831DRAFT_454267 [Entophlyctis helioformis]|nr:hypothetical protein BC831DRAFT_454267 [Entophlyctis helioformis]
MFLGHPNATESFVFPKPEGMEYRDAELFLFEANPNFNKELVDLKQALTNDGIKVNIYPSTPVWIDSVSMPFFIDASNHHAAGSSLDPTHPDPIKTGGKTVNLTTVAISQFLLKNFLPDDFVVVKMDIELAEYAIVPHMADMDVSSVMDYLFVEWHHWLIKGDDPRIAAVNHAADVLKAGGTQLPQYNTVSKR